MQSFYATQTDNKNSSVKYLNNVQLQTTNLQKVLLIEEELNRISQIIKGIDNRIENVEFDNKKIDELNENVYILDGKYKDLLYEFTELYIPEAMTDLQGTINDINRQLTDLFNTTQGQKNNLETIDEKLSSMTEYLYGVNDTLKEEIDNSYIYNQTQRNNLSTNINNQISTLSSKHTNDIDTVKQSIKDLQVYTIELYNRNVNRLDDIDEVIDKISKNIGLTESGEGGGEAGEKSILSSIQKITTDLGILYGYNEGKINNINTDINTLNNSISSIQLYTGTLYNRNVDRLDKLTKSMNEITKIINDDVAQGMESLKAYEISLSDSLYDMGDIMCSLSVYIYETRGEIDTKINKAIETLTNLQLIDNPLYNKYISVLGDVNCIYEGETQELANSKLVAYWCELDGDDPNTGINYRIYHTTDTTTLKAIDSIYSYPDKSVHAGDLWWNRLIHDYQAKKCSIVSTRTLASSVLFGDPIKNNEQRPGYTSGGKTYYQADCESIEAANYSIKYVDQNWKRAGDDSIYKMLSTTEYEFEDGNEVAKTITPDIIFLQFGESDFNNANNPDYSDGPIMNIYDAHQVGATNSNAEFLAILESLLKKINDDYPNAEVYVMSPLIIEDSEKWDEVSTFYSIMQLAADSRYYRFIPAHLFARANNPANIYWSDSHKIYCYSKKGMDSLTKGIERYILSN